MNEQHVVKLGEGKVAVTGGLQVPDNETLVGLLMLEPDRGSGSISGFVPDRHKGDAVFPDLITGTVLEFSDPRSIDVVIEQLAILRCQWNLALQDPVYRKSLADATESAIDYRALSANGQ